MSHDSWILGFLVVRVYVAVLGSIYIKWKGAFLTILVIYT